MNIDRCYNSLELKHKNFLEITRLEWRLVFLVIFVYGYFYSGQNWNQNARLDSIYAFVEPGTPDSLTFRIDRFIYDPVGSKNTGDYAVWNGHYYSNKAPGTVFLGIPVYALLYYGERALGLNPVSLFWIRWNAFLLNLWLSVVWVAIAVIVLFRFLTREWRWSERDALVSVLVFAFGTPLFPFGTSIWGHALTASLVLVAFTSLLSKVPSFLYSGLLLGYSIFNEYPAAVVAPLGIAVVILANPFPLKNLTRYLTGFAPPILALLVYQKVCFGGFLTTAAELSDPRMLVQGHAFGEMGLPSIEVMWRQLFSPLRGIFVYSPVLLAATLGWKRLPPKVRIILPLGIGAALTLIASHKAGWHGGSNTGPRYLIFSLPFWVLALPPWSTISRPLKGLFILLIIVSMANQFFITIVDTMIPPDDLFPLKTIWYRFFHGYFPAITWTAHATGAVPWEEHIRAAFNLGSEFFGLRGPLSLFPLAFIAGWALRKTFVEAKP